MLTKAILVGPSLEKTKSHPKSTGIATDVARECDLRVQVRFPDTRSFVSLEPELSGVGVVLKCVRTRPSDTAGGGTSARCEREHVYTVWLESRAVCTHI